MPALCSSRGTVRAVESPLMSDARTVLEMRGITKQFPSVLANDDVELRPRQRRGACTSRRERRREVHAHEHPVRALTSPMPARSASTDAGQLRLGERCDRKRPWHGASALHAHPGDDRRREHRPRDRANNQGRGPGLRRGSPPGGHPGRAVRVRHRSRRQGRGHLSRPAAAG